MQRTLTILGLLVVLAVLISILHIGGPATTSATKSSQSLVFSTPTQTHSSQAHIVRINQLDHMQYASMQEYDEWAYSSCSTAAMTEIANFYSANHHYRITDILQAEIQAHAISPDLGLLDAGGIGRTLSSRPFYLVTNTSPRSLNQIVALANGGTPVIVSFASSSLYPGGHDLLVIAGNASVVYVADSSKLNIPFFSRSRFLQLWTGYLAVVTPNGGRS